MHFWAERKKSEHDRPVKIDVTKIELLVVSKDKGNHKVFVK